MSVYNQSEHIAFLFHKELTSALTPSEKTALEEWKGSHPAEAAGIANLLSKEQLPLALEKLDNADKYIRSRFLTAQVPVEKDFTAPAYSVHRVQFLKTAWFRYAAAVILIAGTGIYLFNTDRPVGANNYSPLPRTPIINTNSNKATLTLADGSTIILDQSANGNIAQQGNTNIIKIDAGQLAYENRPRPVPTGDPTGRNRPWPVLPEYNTITTPRGSQYQVILPDGTKVWLNAASSIKFPVAFTTNHREVTITGEAYLEVKKDPKKYFSVKVNNLARIDVLGTSFNIKAYEEKEESLKTSLVEGAVKVNEQLLAPGQAWLNGKVVNTDLEQDIAWKKGLFNFNGLPLKDAMNQLARWYDVEIIYEGELPRFGFSGKIGRDVSLSEVVKGLSGIDGIYLRIVNGNKIVVSQ